MLSPKLQIQLQILKHLLHLEPVKSSSSSSSSNTKTTIVRTALASAAKALPPFFSATKIPPGRGCVPHFGEKTLWNTASDSFCLANCTLRCTGKTFVKPHLHLFVHPSHQRGCNRLSPFSVLWIQDLSCVCSPSAAAAALVPLVVVCELLGFASFLVPRFQSESRAFECGSLLGKSNSESGISKRINLVQAEQFAHFKANANWMNGEPKPKRQLKLSFSTISKQVVSPPPPPLATPPKTPRKPQQSDTIQASRVARTIDFREVWVNELP